MYNNSPNAMNGYVSHGQTSDAGSARLSNVNTFKYNGPVPNVRKVSPNGIISGTMDYSSGGENKILPNIQNQKGLPVVKEGLRKNNAKSRSTNRSNNNNLKAAQHRVNII